MGNKESKWQWPIMTKQTKLPKDSQMSKKNKEMLQKIEKWKGKFG